MICKEVIKADERTNGGCKKYPRPMHKRCNSAKKRLDQSYQDDDPAKQAELTASLKLLRKNQELYNLKIVELQAAHSAGQCQRSDIKKLLED